MVKRQIPLFITFITGLVTLCQFFVPRMSNFLDYLQNWIIIISAFALLLGIGNLLKVNLSQISRGGSNVPFNLALLIGFFVTAGTGLYYGIDTSENNAFSYIFLNIYKPLNATMFSLLAFYIASAAFRAFRAKSREAALLLIAAFFVMLGRVPLGAAIWSKFPDIADWIMKYPTTAGQRAILIGAALGAISVSIKILLGLERSYLGGGE